MTWTPDKEMGKEFSRSLLFCNDLEVELERTSGLHFNRLIAVHIPFRRDHLHGWRRRFARHSVGCYVNARARLGRCNCDAIFANGQSLVAGDGILAPANRGAA